VALPGVSRGILVERKMRAGALVIVDVRGQDAAQVALVEDHDVIQTLLRSSSSRTAWVRNVHLIELKDGVKTFDYQGSQRAESHSIEAIANLTEAIQIDGSIGSILADLGRSDFIGSIRGDFSLFSGKLSASVSRGMLTWGAETIRNRVMTTDFAL